MTLPGNKHKSAKEIVTGNVLEESHTLCKHFFVAALKLLILPAFIKSEAIQITQYTSALYAFVPRLHFFNNAFLGPILVLRPKYNSH